MEGRKQLERSRRIEAPLDEVWAVIDDAGQLAAWAPAVREVVRHERRESVGATRECDVELAGKPGRMVERCVAREDGRVLAYVVDEESFGMRRMFDHYGFRISLAPDGEHTCATIETFYTPRHLLASAANAVLMRRRLGRVVEELLAGLARYLEPASPRAARELACRVGPVAR